jgi:hypothetical protein
MTVVIRAALILGSCFAFSQARAACAEAQRYDGHWWLSVEVEERSGFIEGAGDCLTWTARKPGFNAISRQLEPKVTRFYETHAARRALLVTEVWTLLERTPANQSPPQGGEVWSNAHWYLNGSWWRQSSETEQLGYVKGYLWCVQAEVTRPRETYSRSAAYYGAKISAYAKSHPKADDEAVATILARYRDAPR